ncbi:MAG TPA: tRNA (adenosine(37)-N6)-threonylcarbamoyltransferase complex ATPase subunit type 1 TsaE [Anaeromyxobacteraceae bacterium]|nr:tRNA (adenosine(37)-N6)-threonylcarbamoyltransferase complex ATPase subunit type 1 TsaE [Anaeromyxobacteraceae bacterium]
MTAAPARLAVRRISRSARATSALGERLGRLLAPGDAVALTGELGAGKTQLVRGACRGARVPEGQVSSPSFAIVATYRGRLPVHHADLYRVGDADELHGTGFFDLLGSDGAVLVEWADRVPGALPAERLEIHLEHDARRSHVRHLEIVGTGGRGVALARALTASRAGALTPRGARGTRVPSPRERGASGVTGRRGTR